MPGILSGLLDLVFSPVCLGCDGPILPADPVRLVCRRCRTRLRPVPPPICTRCGAPRLRTGRTPGPTCAECDDWPTVLRFARSARLLHPPADRLIYQLKYRGWRTLAGPLAECMTAVRLPEDASAAATVVPVPTTSDRIRERGYNQAEALALAYARRTRRIVHTVLERTRATASQTALQPAARGANVAGAFRVTPGRARDVVGRTVLLLDDVMTTGATAVECTRMLAAAGARAVGVVTFARALDVRRLTGLAGE